jgi:beta-lactam-binding protein with PASTA domain
MAEDSYTSSPPQRSRFRFLDRHFPLGSTKRKLSVWLGIPLVVFVLFMFTFDKIIMPMVTRQGKAFPAPNLINQRLLEADISLNELGLGYKVGASQYSPGKPPGVILNQYPPPGTMVKAGREIRFVVSLGQKQVPVPNVAGKSVRQALLDLETAGLLLGEIAWAFSDTIPERVVVFSYPAAGTEIPMGSYVNLMVNRGRASNFTYVPKVIGMPLPEARRKLEEKALRAGVVKHRRDDKVLPETVLEQSEPEGAEVDVGSEIDLVVSQM